MYRLGLQGKKFPLREAQRTVEPDRLHHAGQGAQASGFYVIVLTSNVYIVCVCECVCVCMCVCVCVCVWFICIVQHN